MRFSSIILVLLLALAFQAVAHGPVVDVSGLKLIRGDGGIFLAAQLDPPEGGAILIAASTPFGSARLERRNGSGYQPTEKIAISHQQAVLGPTTLNRVRLPEIPRGARTVPVTLLFTGGSMLQLEAQLPKAYVDNRVWTGAAFVVILLVLGLWLAVGRRSALKRSKE